MAFTATAKYPGAIAAVTDMPNTIDFVSTNTRPTLNTTMDNVVTSVVVSSGQGAQFPAGDFFITIENEILYCSTMSSDTLTVIRGQAGTSAASHTAGVTVDAFIVAELLNQMAAEINAIETAIGVNLNRIIAIDIVMAQYGLPY